MAASPDSDTISAVAYFVTILAAVASAVAAALSARSAVRANAIVEGMARDQERRERRSLLSALRSDLVTIEHTTEGGFRPEAAPDLRIAAVEAGMALPSVAQSPAADPLRVALDLLVRLDTFTRAQYLAGDPTPGEDAWPDLKNRLLPALRGAIEAVRHLDVALSDQLRGR